MTSLCAAGMAFALVIGLLIGAIYRPRPERHRARLVGDIGLEECEDNGLALLTIDGEEFLIHFHDLDELHFSCRAMLLNRSHQQDEARVRG